MPEQQPHAETPPGGWHLQMSKLLSVLFVVAIAATGGLIVTLILGLSAGPPPGSPPPGGGGGNGGPPPFDFRTIEVFTVMTGIFVLSWLSVLVVYVRDQVLQRLQVERTTEGISRDELTGLLGELRAQLAADQAEAIAEYGERRETDGYLSGMRMATGGEASPGNVRSLRRTPPQR